jgi:hypothetical protein
MWRLVGDTILYFVQLAGACLFWLDVPQAVVLVGKLNQASTITVENDAIINRHSVLKVAR